MARPLGSTNLPKIRDYIHSKDISEMVKIGVAKAIKDKDVIMLKFFIEQVFGKAPQTMDVTTGGDKLTSVKVNIIDGSNNTNPK